MKIRAKYISIRDFSLSLPEPAEVQFYVQRIGQSSHSYLGIVSMHLFCCEADKQLVAKSRGTFAVSLKMKFVVVGCAILILALYPEETLGASLSSSAASTFTPDDSTGGMSELETSMEIISAVTTLWGNETVP